MSTAHPTALIAEDEPLLAAHLQQALQKAWPQLQVLDVVDNGISAVEQALRLKPDILFFDIRMPGQTGLEAAVELADTWPDASSFPALIFVTAYDQYAIEAFEAQAMDYVLKPVQTERLARTVQRLQTWWSTRSNPDALPTLERTMQQLHRLMQQPAQATPALQFLQASVGNTIHMVPVNEVVYLEAADKYVRVLTAEREYLIRTALKDLLPQIDAQQFWQVHRGTVVRAASIASAQRDEAGRLWLTLRERPEKLSVSRLYAALFKSM